jgi:hypothetical protein
MADMHDTGQKLIEAFCDIDALVAENERMRELLTKAALDSCGCLGGELYDFLPEGY